MSWRHCARTGLALLVALSLTPAAVATGAAPELAGHREGAIEVPGSPGGIHVELAVAADGTLGGDIPSPAALARAALADFDAFAEQTVTDGNVPGLALAVVCGGEVVYARGFGYRDLEAQLPMTPDSLFAIGSTTKAFTTTLLGMLVDEGVLDWDQPVRTYLPSFALSDPVTTERLTPRDMVTHRSGLPRHDLVWYNNNAVTRAEMVSRLAHLELSADLRAKYHYNNLMFMAAGYLAEQLTGISWEEAVRTRIFAPLGMTRSNFAVADSQRDEDFAQPYRLDDDDQIERIPFRPIDLIGPAGSINSSVNEMSRWLLLHLNRGKLGDRQLINASTLADTHSPHMTTGESPERVEISQSTYALGWRIDTYRGHRRVHHGGGIDGFSTSVILFPDDDLGLVSFTNRGSGLPYMINQHAADRILGLEPIDWIGEALAEREKGKAAAEEAEKNKEATRKTGTHPSHELAEYAGDYVHPGYGIFAVTLVDGVLRATLNDITTPLDHWHYDVFVGAETDGALTYENQKFQFRSDVDGNIAALEVLLEPRVDPIVFHKRPDARLFDPDYLQRLAGKYERADGEPFTVELTGDWLTLTRPGDQRVTLVPDLSGRFVIRELAVISIAFEVDAHGNVTGAQVYQPDGVYAAKRVK